MKKSLFTLLLAFMANLTLAQQTVKITEFEGAQIMGLIADGSFDIRISQGENTGLTIEAREDYASKVSYEMTDDGYVRINYGSDVGQFLKGKKRPYVEVVVSQLRYLNLSGNSSTIGKGEYSSDEISEITVATSCSLEFIRITAPRVTLDLTGGAKVDEFTITAQEARIDLSYTSKATLKGEIGVGDIKTSGTSSLDMLMVNSEKLNVVTGGVSRVRANLTGEATVSCGGTSSFRYIGDGILSGDGKKL